VADSINPTANSQTMAVAVSGLKAQQARMRVIAENLANADSTATTPGGNPYRRQMPVFTTSKIDGANGVRMAEVRQDNSNFKLEYDPGHPAADANGYVKRPNVEPLIEALDMREAQRAYEANLNVIDTARAMETDTLSILKNG
jgi:flagellar basal-body rod protein FlgC